MTEESRNNTSKILIGVIIALAIGVFVAGYFLFQQSGQLEDRQEENELIKQQLEDEYESLSVQYEGFKINMKNDSLLHKLDNEQAKVQRLLEELKTVKAENKTEIARLKNELASLRKVLKHYVAQIDSLNRVNEKLRAENKEITTKYQQTSKTLSTISEEKNSLSEKVTLAAKLDATSLSVAATNKKGKVQKNVKKVEQLIVNFTLAKNITAEPGERVIYVRIMKPDGDVLVKNRANVFPYENREINYSIKRLVEYGGEELPVTLYWEVEEFLMQGAYRLDVFCDGNMIGSRAFTIGKE